MNAYARTNPNLNIFDYFKNNLKHFSYNLTLFHIFFNFLIMRYSSFSSSVILLTFSSSFLLILSLFLCFSVSVCAFHLHFLTLQFTYLAIYLNLIVFLSTCLYLLRVCFSVFFSLSRNLSGLSSLSCFILSLLRLNLSM